MMGVGGRSAYFVFNCHLKPMGWVLPGISQSQAMDRRR